MVRRMTATELPVITPRERTGAACCTAAPTTLSEEAADKLATVVKALAHPARLRIVDALHTKAPEAICQCEFQPLFDMSQPALAKHLKVLIEAGVLASERRGLWAYYYLRPDTLKELSAWLS
jgi:ArsR family transcriptional regulator